MQTRQLRLSDLLEISRRQAKAQAIPTFFPLPSDNSAVDFNRSTQSRQLLEFFEALQGYLIGIEACRSAHLWARELIDIGRDRAPDAYDLCQAICETRKHECCRCGGDWAHICFAARLTQSANVLTPCLLRDSGLSTRQ